MLTNHDIEKMTHLYEDFQERSPHQENRVFSNSERYQAICCLMYLYKNKSLTTNINLAREFYNEGFLNEAEFILSIEILSDFDGENNKQRGRPKQNSESRDTDIVLTFIFLREVLGVTEKEAKQIIDNRESVGTKAIESIVTKSKKTNQYSLFRRSLTARNQPYKHIFKRMSNEERLVEIEKLQNREKFQIKYLAWPYFELFMPDEETNIYNMLDYFLTAHKGYVQRQETNPMTAYEIWIDSKYFTDSINSPS